MLRTALIPQNCCERKLFIIRIEKSSESWVIQTETDAYFAQEHSPGVANIFTQVPFLCTIDKKRNAKTILIIKGPRSSDRLKK